MMIKLNKLLRDNRGANLVEYLILVGLVALVALAGFKAFGSKITAKIGEQTSKVDEIR